MCVVLPTLGHTPNTQLTVVAITLHSPSKMYCGYLTLDEFEDVSLLIFTNQDSAA